MSEQWDPDWDETLPRLDPFSAAAQARVKKRYAAEARFRRLGLAAVLLAAAFVLALLGNIVVQGLPAFFEHRVSLEVTLDASKIDPAGQRSNEDLRAADYQRLLSEALHMRFPAVSARGERRKLERLISTGAADDLRAMVLANPALVGTRLRFSALLSTDADLYFKGQVSSLARTAGAGALEARVEDGQVRLSGAPGAFAAPYAEVRAGVKAQLDALEATLAAAPNSADAALAASRADLITRRDALQARLAPPDQPLAVDFATMPSLLVDMADTRIRLSTLSPDAAQGTLMGATAGAALPPRAERWSLLRYLTPEGNRRISDLEATWLEALRGDVEQHFAARFFANGDSREPELAGIRGALIGSALTLLVTLAVCLPLGVGAAVYLEEFAPKNRLTDLLEVNINNLAAVPSIVFGLLGLAVFLNAFHMPRSAPLVGGLVLALLVLPTIIIAARAALKAVPPSIKEAALALGASHQQAIFHHVLPLAMPGIMTGTIIGMAHALGETAPLLMIGMVAFIVEAPQTLVDAATVLPVQIYLWSDLPEAAFRAKTAAAILVLLAVLIGMNGIALLLRRRFERRW